MKGTRCCLCPDSAFLLLPSLPTSLCLLSTLFVQGPMGRGLPGAIVWIGRDGAIDGRGGLGLTGAAQCFGQAKASALSA